MKLRTRRALALAGSAVALSIALTGCSTISSLLGGGGDATRDEETGEVTEGANIDIFSLKVGDCKMESSSGLVSDTDVVPCSEPHDEEVYYEIKMEDGEFSEDAIDAASEECGGEPFTTFIGIDYNSSSLEVYPLVPTQETWDELNDRIIQCIVYNPAGPTTGSLQGTGL
ncbi:septum formation family protein [Microbacterium sp.]|uniref:septum formation family protein n=1 Tax=Microbacterium sp. TaxID=51671 RepID=UPI0039E5905B